MKNLSKEEIKDYIVANHKEKTNAEMCLELGVSIKTVSANATWLHKKGIIDLNESKTGFNAEKHSRIKTINHYKNCVINNINIHDNHVGYKVGEYQNGKGENKTHAKKIMQDHIIATNISGHIGTLTNLFIDMETAIYNAMPNCYFTAVEWKSTIFEQMRKKFKNCGVPIKCIKGEFSKILYGENANTYAHLIMDYCGDLTTIAKEFEYTIQNNLVVVGGIIALTTNKINRRGSGEMWDYITSLSNEKTINKDFDFRCDTEIQNERYLYSVLGRNYVVLEVFSYTDKYPMTLTIIKRIN